MDGWLGRWLAAQRGCAHGRLDDSENPTVGRVDFISWEATCRPTYLKGLGGRSPERERGVFSAGASSRG